MSKSKELRSLPIFALFVASLGTGLLVFLLLGGREAPEPPQGSVGGHSEHEKDSELLGNELVEYQEPKMGDREVPAALLSVDEVSNTEREERFPNERKIRELFASLKALAASGEGDGLVYQSQLAELEELIRDSGPKYAELLVLLHDEFGDPYSSVLNASDDGWQLIGDVENMVGYIWGQEDPEGSLVFLRNSGNEEMMSGWLTAQMVEGTDFEGLLESNRVPVSDDIYWRALLDVAETDTLLSLDYIISGYMGSMDLGKWREILFSKGNSGDTALAGWFQENIQLLSDYPEFDEVEVIRMLRRYDYGEGPFMLSKDVALVESAKSSRDYEGAARIAKELSELYGGVIDASVVGRFPLNWSKRDLLAASSWLVDNGEFFSDPESLESMLGTMFRHRAPDDPESVLDVAMGIEDETYRGFALSNTLIPQIEKSGVEIPTQWVSDLPRGFPKQRTMAGFVLGLSRHRDESTLEAQVKFQFMQDEFDLDAIETHVMNSGLSAYEKTSVIDLFNSY